MRGSTWYGITRKPDGERADMAKDAEGSRARTQIIVALIGIVGVLGAALLANRTPDSASSASPPSATSATSTTSASTREQCADSNTKIETGDQSAVVNCSVAGQDINVTIGKEQDR